MPVSLALYVKITKLPYNNEVKVRWHDKTWVALYNILHGGQDLTVGKGAIHYGHVATEKELGWGVQRICIYAVCKNKKVGAPPTVQYFCELTILCALGGNSPLLLRANL